MGCDHHLEQNLDLNSFNWANLLAATSMLQPHLKWTLTIIHHMIPISYTDKHTE